MVLKDNIDKNLKNYAIVHGSSSNNTYNKMQFFEPKMKSIFIEKYDKKLYKIAPMLVDLNELKEVDDEFIPYLLTEARKENAVLFFSSYYGFDELHQYFTKLTMASTPTARTLYNEEVEYEEKMLLSEIAA